jgi:hypothetical protein
MTNLGLNIGVLNREVSSWQMCPLREVPLYFQCLIKFMIKSDRKLFLKATDDETKNVFYSTIDGNTKDNAFEVNRNTGVFSLRRPLNYAEAPGGKGVYVLFILQLSLHFLCAYQIILYFPVNKRTIGTEDMVPSESDP